VIRRLALLIGGSTIFWILAALAGRSLWGNIAVVYSGVAAVLCLIPTALTMAWAGCVRQGSPEQQLIRMLAATGMRIVVVLAGTLALYRLFPYFHERQGFLVWVVVFYLFTLGFETLLLVSGRSAEEESHGSGRSV
jgi:hypothetical protein